MKSFWDFLKTASLVTIITAIVWLFAESETLREQKFTIEVTPDRAGAGGLAMRLATSAQTARAEVVLQGASARLEEVDRRLRAPITLVPGAEGVPQSPGEFDVDLLTVLRGQRDMVELGLTVERVEPATTRIVLDEFVTRDLPVRVEAEGVEFQSPPTITPPRVRVRLPRGDAERLPDGGIAIVRLDDDATSRLVPGRTETLRAVRVDLPELLPGPPLDAGKVLFDPLTVEVAVVVRGRTAETTIPRVPVHVRMAPGELARWNVEISEDDRSLIDVKVSGPPELIRQIEERSLPVVATLALSYEELEKGIAAKEATFSDLPTGLKFEVASRVIRVRITRR